MNELIIFAIEFLLLSTSFYLGFLIIRNYTTPTFKRFYLLAWLIFSVAFPFITIESQQSLEMNVDKIVRESSLQPTPDVVLVEDDNLVQSVEVPESLEPDVNHSNDASTDVNWMQILKISYLTISGFFLLRIFIGLIQIWKLRLNAGQPSEMDKSVFVVNNPTFKGASFFGWIFIGKSVSQESEVILQHERIHQRLGHSFDILISHIYCAIFWINPLSWVLKRFISLNTELEADGHMLRMEGVNNYADTLLALSNGATGPKVMNHFGAFHLKSRIVALSRTVQHRKWVSVFSLLTVGGLFFLISCETANTSEVMVERMGEVKTITTRFTSHQSDTQQKTGKIVAIASFSPDGTLDELVEQTTYPYDREYEVKKNFWESPEKTGIPYVMDGLSLGEAEKSFVYGNDWPNAYYKFLNKRNERGDMPWRDIITTDNEAMPTEIQKKHEKDESIWSIGMPDVTEFFEYEGQKVVRVLSQSIYPAFPKDDKRYKRIVESWGKRMNKDSDMYKEMMEKLDGKKEKKKLTAAYTYDGELLTSLKGKGYEHKFYYENKLMIKSEYFRNEELINTRIHYYKNSLKDRTEIFNRYNEPEYTITYEYEFW